MVEGLMEWIKGLGDLTSFVAHYDGKRIQYSKLKTGEIAITIVEDEDERV